MKRQWRVRRQLMAVPDGQRRWDRAYQLLAEWTPPVAPAMPGAVPMKEVTHAPSDLPARVDQPAGAGPDD